ncbi:MAG: alpha-L-arabinofuranosidase [Clostridia bacterium]|nr:alpha-L-arabinofuranosidase [Clostridia bacterium]
MARKATISLHPSYVKGDISPRLFGAFLEPIGKMAVGSMWQPGHPTADEKGLRHDFIDALVEAGLPSVRYGGNYVSGWRWKDSVGPYDQRKPLIDRSRSCFIPKEVGADEYLTFIELCKADIMWTLNLGTDDIDASIDFIDYTNVEGGLEWADKRKEFGREKPYGVKIFYLGNEMDGPWQVASWEKDPVGYGVKAREVSKALKYTDGTVETIACVSSCPFLTHYPDWDRQVLEQCYEVVDYISLHHYHSALPGDIGALMAGVVTYERYIDTEIALSDYIKTLLRTDKTMYISLDEYGSSFRPQRGNPQYGTNGNLPIKTFFNFNNHIGFRSQDPNNWDMNGFGGFRRVGEMAMALANASTMLAMVRRADRVKIGCATGGLGMLAATDKDHVWKAAAYYPMTELIRYCKGKSILPMVNCETYDVPSYAIDDQNQYSDILGVPYVTAAAALNEEAGEFTVFVVNGDWEQEEELTLDVKAFEGYKFVEHITMYSDEFEAANTYENPDAIKPVVVEDTKCVDGKINVTVNKLSWNVFRFEKA